MNSWTFFQTVFDGFDTQFLAAVQGMANALIAAVRTPLLVGVTIWLAGTTAIELYQPGNEPLLMLVRKVIRAGFVLGLVGAAGYTAIFTTLMLTTLPNEITAAITGTGDAGALTPAAFDKMFSGGWVAVVQIWENLSAWSVKSIVVGLTATVEAVVGSFFIGIGFAVFVASHVMLGLVIIVGPLFVCMLLWEKTVYLFNAWISGMLALVMTQVLIVAMLGLLLTTETNILTQITALNGATGANANDVAGQIHYLIEAGILYFLIGYLSPRIAELAQALTHGAAPGISAFSQMAHGAVASGAMKAASKVADAAGSAGSALGSAGAAGMRSLTPAGRAP